MNFNDQLVLARFLIGEEKGSLLFNPEHIPTDEDLKGIVADQAIESSLLKDFEAFKLLRFNNGDGSIRWLIDASNQKAQFLNLYHTEGWRSRLIAFVLTLIFSLKLQKVFFKPLYIYLKSDQYFQQEISKHSFAIFTGTVGPGRTVIVDLLDKEYGHSILKLPVYEEGKDFLDRECSGMRTFEAINFSKVKVPVILEEKNNHVKFSFIGCKGKASSSLKNGHFNYLKELYEYGIKAGALNSFNWFEIPFEGLKLKKEIPPVLSKLNETISKVKSSLNRDQIIYASNAHGDFTPWNMKCCEDELYLYDFELSGDFYPLLYDAFHFIYQQTVMVENGNEENINQKLQRLEQQLNVFVWYRELQIDFDLYHMLYLLSVSSVYFTIYLNQEKLHRQANTIINVWVKQLNNLKDVLCSPSSLRQEFLKSFFQQLNEKSVAYGVMKNTAEDLTALEENKDLDILIGEADAGDCIDSFYENASIERLSVQSFSFMKIIGIHFKNGDFLEVDFIHQAKWKSLVLFDTATVLKKCVQHYNGVKTIHPIDDMLYTACFYQLNNSGIPTKYLSWFKRKLNVLGIEPENVTQINFAYGADWETLEHFQSEAKRKIIQSVSSKSFNKQKSKIYNKVNYLKDTIKRYLGSKGFAISFSGVDGAGKSTTIDNIRIELEEKFRKKTVLLRHRPSILPILSSFIHGKAKAESIAAEQLPHSGENASVLSSLLRFCYYYADYFFGQWVVYFKYILRGYIVIYDRYYFDFIADSKRSNININSSLVKSAYRFVHKPAVNFFLYAPTEIILERKQELSKLEIESMTNSYLNIFNEFRNRYRKEKYLPITNLDFKKTEANIINSIKALI